MKCICGYEHDSGLDDKGKWQDYLKGDERFVRIFGSLYQIHEDDRTNIEVYLFACPKCSTVLMTKY